MKIAPQRLIVLILLAAYGWRIHGITDQSLWRDEVDAIFFALRPLSDTLSMFTAAAQNGPLYFLSLRPWFRIVGSSEFALRYPSLMAGILSIALTWRVARLLLVYNPKAQDALTDSFASDIATSDAKNSNTATDSPLENVNISATAEPPPPQQRSLSLLSQDGKESFDAIPLLAALFLAFNPYQLWYSQEGKMYALIVCLSLLSSWFWLLGIDQDVNQQSRSGTWRPWLAYLIVTSAAIYSHLLMILIIPLHMVWFVIAWPQSRRHWRGYLLALAGLTLPYLPMVWWQWRMVTSATKMTGFNFTPLRDVLRTLILNQSRGFMPPGDLIWLAPIFFLGLAGLLMGILEIDAHGTSKLPRLPGWRRFLLLVSWLLGPILFIYILSLRQPIFTDRYIIWIAPAAAMILALGVRVLWHNAAILSKPLSAVFVVYLIGFWLYAGWQQKITDIKYDLRSAVSYVAERRTEDELLILQIPHLEYSYRYYSSRQGTHPFVGSDQRLGRWAGGLWTNNGFPDDQAKADVATQMQELTDGVESIWVVRSEVEMWDQRHLMDAWLNEHAVLIDSADFHGSQVRHYRLRR